METLIACPICDSSTFSKARSCVDHTVSRETFTIVACDKCGFQFTNPRPKAEEIGPYYESEDYISHTGNTGGIIGVAYRWVRARTLRRKLNLIQSFSPGQHISLLDVGSGTGEFLNVCAMAGHSVRGIEPSIKAREFSIVEYKLDVQGEEALSAIQGDSQDVITMWHVLEHVHKLKGRVEELSRLLKKGGVVIVAVPNRASWDAKKYGSDWAAYDVPRHLYHFTRADIKRLFESTSFRLETTLPMKFDSYYVSMLSDKNRGKGSLISSTWNGLVSNLNASIEKGTWSSQIYVLRKQ